MVMRINMTIAGLRGLPFWAGIACILGLVYCLILSTAAEARPNGLARIAVDAHTGEILYASRSQVKWHPASLTKMMTLYELFSAMQRGKVSLNTRIKMSPRAVRQPPSKLGLRAGNTISVSDAIDVLAVKSANDVAVAVGEKLAGSEIAFAKQMTRTARRLGMSRTTFRNASGLHHSKQVSTARDMAILSVALMRDFPQHYDRFSKKSFRYGKRTYRSHNRILTQYSGADGIKTGYIAKAGFNLAASAVRGEKRVVAIVLGAKSSAHRSTLMTRLLDTGFSELKKSSRARIARPLPVRLSSPPPIPRPRGGYKPVVPETPPRFIPLPRPDPRQIPVVAAVAANATRGSAAHSGPAARSSHDDANYAIQLGAYHTKPQARARLLQVMNRLPLSHAEVEPAVIAKPGRSSRTIYRARLIGYGDRAEADAACDWLKARRSECMVVQTQG